MSRPVVTNYSVTYKYGLNQVFETESNIKSSLGKGFLENVTMGYEHNNFVSTEINFSYLIGKPTVAEHNYYYYSDKDVLKYDITGKMFSVTPTLILSYKAKDSKLYLSIGIPINFISYVQNINGRNIDLISGNTNDQYSFHSKIKFTGQPGAGFIIKIGIEKIVNEYITLFGEVAAAFIDWSPNKSEITEYNVNGEDRLSTLSVSQIKTEYMKEISAWGNVQNGEITENSNPNYPRRRLKFYVPFSFTSVSIGVKINISQIQALTKII